MGVSIAAVWVPATRIPIAVLDGLLAGAVAFDWFSMPSPERLDVRRSVPPRAGLDQDFVRRLRIEAGPAGGQRLDVHEEFAPAVRVRARTVGVPGPRPDRGDRAWPAGLEPAAEHDPSGGPDVVVLPRSGPLDVLRVYASERRGTQWIGDVRLRLLGRLGLVWRQSKLRGDAEVAIEPALLGLSQTLGLAASQRWSELGVRHLRRPGGLTEFESLRDYVVGDDVRQVDWKAFARRGRPMVRDYQEERGQEMFLVVDVGRRMATAGLDGALRTWSKLDHALDLALQLGAVALQRGDRVGVVAFDSAVRAFVAPARGVRQLARLREAVFDLQPSSLESDLENALRDVSVRHRRRTMLIVLSDVPDALSARPSARALAVGGAHHRVLFVGLDDPVLRRIVDGDSGERAAVRVAALELAAERRRALRELSGSGVRVLDLPASEAAAPLLAAWLDVRRSGIA